MAVSLRRDGFRFLQYFCGSRAAWIVPTPRYFQVAIGTVTVFQEVSLDLLPTATNKQRLARRAKRACRIGMNVPLIDVVQSGFQRDSTGAVQCFRRSSRLVLQLKIRVESCEVQGHLGSQIFEDPLSQAAKFFRVII